MAGTMEVDPTNTSIAGSKRVRTISTPAAKAPTTSTPKAKVIVSLPTQAPINKVVLPKGVKAQRQLIMLPLNIDGKQSPEHDPIKHSPCDARDESVARRSSLWSIAPRPQAGFEEEVIAKFMSSDITTEFADNPFISQLMNRTYSPDEELARQMAGETDNDDDFDPPDANIVKDGKFDALELRFATSQQAAIFNQTKSFTVTTSGSKPVVHTLKFIKAGWCHDDNQITLKITPAPPKGENMMDVPDQAYIDAINNQLDHVSVMTVEGAWREAVKWNTGIIQKRPAMYLTVMYTFGFESHNIPGYSNTTNFHGSDSDMAPIETKWFMWTFSGRRRYCELCKFTIHPQEDCKKIECFGCGVRGHVRKNCPGERRGRK